MSLADVVALTITAATVFPTRDGFGIPLVLAYHSETANIVDEYTSTQEMVDDGWPATHEAYKKVEKIFSQNPRPKRVLIGKRATAFTQILRIIPVKTTVGYKYKFKVRNTDGTLTSIEFTVATGTVAAICTGLQALLDPLADVAATDDTTHVTLTVTAGKVIGLEGLPKVEEMRVKDMTADPGIVADLQAVEAVDSKTWYGLLVDRAGGAEIAALASHVEGFDSRKLYIANTSDWDVITNAETGDIASSLKTSSYARTALLFCQNATNSHSDGAWLGGVLPTDPGRTHWIFRTLRGIAVDDLSGTNETALKNKYVSFYTLIGNVGTTQGGKTAAGEFIDVIHFIDWLFSNVRLDVFAAFKAAADRGEKIEYDDGGVDIIRSVILAVLGRGIRQKGLSDDPAPVVEAPKVADISETDRANRLLPDVTFRARLAGAIIATEIDGTLSV